MPNCTSANSRSAEASEWARLRPVSRPQKQHVCVKEVGSPALSMKTSFSPQPLATVAGEYPRSWGQEAEIINFAGDSLSCEQVQSDSPVYGS